MDIKILASGSTGNAYIVSDGSTSLLLDAGIPLRAIQVGSGFRVGQLSGCLITHAHGDHSKAAKALARFGIDVYTSAGTIEACGLTGHRIKPVRALEEFRVCTFQVLPFDVDHDAPEPLGFLLTSAATGEKLLYFTDTYFVRYRFTGLTHIMAECNYSKEGLEHSVREGYIPIERVPRLMKRHMSLEHLLEMLQSNDLRDVRQIYLLHLSADNSEEDRFRREVQCLTGAEVYVC